MGKSAEAVKNSPPINYDTYKGFWDLQSALAHPKKAISNSTQWTQFVEQVRML